MPQNLRFALRLMLKSPAFTAIAVLTLGLGIGANTAIFSVVNALVLRPLPLKDPGRLMLISGSTPGRGFRGSSFSLASYESVRDGCRAFAGVAGFCFDSLTLTGAAEPEQLAAARVSPDFFDVLGTPPLMGRGLRASGGDAGAAPRRAHQFRSLAAALRRRPDDSRQDHRARSGGLHDHRRPPGGLRRFPRRVRMSLGARLC